MPRKCILIADDDAALTRALAIRCEMLGIDVRTSPDGLHALQALVASPPDLLILDIGMPGADGLLMCEELAADPRFAAIPTIILTGRSDPATIERCRALRVRYAQKGPNAWEALLPMICETLHVENAEHSPLRGAARVAPPPPELTSDDAPPCVLVVDDDPEICRAFRVRLSAYGLRVAEAHSGMEGFWSALKCRPDAIITDFTMPDGQGDYLIGRLREHSLTRETPILVLTGQTVGGLVNHAIERETLGLGATRFFTKPPDFAVILGELRKYVSIRRPVPAGV